MEAHQQHKDSFNIERRQTLKILGCSLLGLTALSATGCRPTPSTSSSPNAVAPSQTVDRGQMTYRQNPKCPSDNVSLLGFGCMRFPTIPDPKNSENKIIDEESSYALIDYAWSHGVNYYDTAYFYHDGASETMIGKALARYPRSSYYLADKMPGRAIESLEQAKEIFAEQLRKCQTDYFDYYLLHNLNDMEQTKRVYLEYGVLDYLLEEKKRGRIRNLGWSFHGDRELFLFALNELHTDWDFVQIQLNYHDWMLGDERNLKKNREAIPAKWMYDLLHERHIPIIVMEPLLGGRLAKPSRAALNILNAAEPEASAASWAFRYVGSFPDVLVVLSGMTYMEHLQENLKTFAPLQPLNDRERQTLDKALAELDKKDTIPCTACNYCMPCPYGVNIPAIFSHYNKCVDQGTLPENAQDPEYMRYRREFLIGYDRAANPLQQADRCISCGKCAPHCPQNIAIPTKMMEIYKFRESLRGHHHGKNAFPNRSGNSGNNSAATNSPTSPATKKG